MQIDINPKDIEKLTKIATATIRKAMATLIPGEDFEITIKIFGGTNEDGSIRYSDESSAFKRSKRHIPL